jgi:hypothetical protein
LRASDEAINVLVGALDTDVESAQIATEVKLENLIRRGRLSDAQLAAQQARYRTVQYGETLRRKLEATRRDVRAVDWEREVPDLIDEALTHIEERYRYENAILTNITQTRDDAEDPLRKRKAAELVEIVSDCIRRHTQLQARLQEAGGTFRAEQDRQQFSGQAQRAVIDLFGHLLVPALDLPVAQAVAPVAVFFGAVSGLAPPRLPRLLRLVEQLLAPPQDRGHLLGDVPEPDLAQLPDPDVFSEEQWDQASELLELDEVPRRLSVLYGPRPPRTGKRGRPRVRGDRLGTCGQIAAGADWAERVINVYGHDTCVQIAAVAGLWHGSFKTAPGRVILVRDPASPRAYDLGLFTLDTSTDPAAIAERYSWRWPIEPSNATGKQILGVGDACNRVQKAVERTVPFGFLIQTLLIVWYTVFAYDPADIDRRRRLRPWYRTKTSPSAADMLARLRRDFLQARICAIGPVQGHSGQINLDAWTCDCIAA